jgi:hypothetical protein
MAHRFEIEGYDKGDAMKKRSEYGLIEQRHKTVLRDFTTKRSFCTDKKCKFHGKMAEQGVCFTVVNKSLGRYFAESWKRAESILAFNRKHNYKKLSQKQMMKRLESEVVCSYMNYHNCLDELIWLRGENARLRGRLGIFRKH